ncbi:MAG: PilZ domain-containing protein [Melioribacteraceae bacterium]|nr:PilZ domain-containing protein [Melioribacteraceae bacterium]
MDNIKNTRKHKRYKVESMEISGRMVLADYVELLDISVGGVALQTEKRLYVGNEYMLKIAGKEQMLTVRGTIVWSFLDESRTTSNGDVIPIYKVGMKFTDNSGEKMKEVTNFIESHKKESDKEIDIFSLSGNRAHIRFHIDTPKETTVNYSDVYSVKNMSLDGLLIESESVIKIEDKIPMEMILPENKVIEFLGRIVRCNSITPKQYETGIEFLNMSEEDKEILKEYILSLDD